MIHCPSCKAENLTGAIFCDGCGTYLFTSSQPPIITRDLLNGPKSLSLKHSRGVIELGAEANVILGREPSSQDQERLISLADLNAIEKGISRNHLHIYWRDSKFFVRDLGSTNGTWINLVRINQDESTQITNGDNLRLGTLDFEVILG